MQFEFTVVTLKGKTVFQCIAHHSKQTEDLLIESDFYTRFGKTGVPTGDHYELELVNTSWLPPGKHAIHIHQNKLSGRNFVCWPNQLATIEEAQAMFRGWCVGTAYTLLTGNDFVSLFDGDFKKFINNMDRTYGIRIMD